MKNKYLLSLLWVIVSGFGVLMAQEIAIIPQPAHLIVKNESFKFGKQLKVCIASYRGDSVTLVFDSFKDDFQKATGSRRPAGVEYSDRRNRRCSPFRMEGLYAGRGQALFRKR